jgi:hypothetical protein
MIAGNGEKKMTDYIEETLKFIESKEMREYLRTRLNWFGDEYSGNTCTEIVANARAPVETKLPALELIAEQAEYDLEHHWNNPVMLAKSARTALNERYDNTPPGTIFTLKYSYRWDRKKHIHEETSPFVDFDAALLDIKEGSEDWRPQDHLGDVWYDIAKWLPGENGKFDHYCEWTLNAVGDIWFFDYWNGNEPEDWEELYNCLGELNLPVPFQVGDIILADCRPFARERRVLITDIGDNRDCCSLTCIFMEPDEKVGIGAFKHNGFLSRAYDEETCISALYRAERWKFDLPDDEAPLGIIRDAIMKDHYLIKQIEDRIWESIDRQYRDDKDRQGINWEELKSRFGL